MDGAVSKLAVRLVNCKISKWELDGEHNDQDRSVPSSVNNKSPPIRKIFVANLSGRTSYCDLRHLFRRYGKVIDAHVSRDKFTRTKRGFGFVTFKYPEDAVSVLKLQHGELKLHLRKLYVAAADSWHQPIELPDGTILWNPNSRDSSRHQQHSSVQEVDYPEAQTDNEVLPSSGSTAGNNREIGAVGGSGLPSYISSCNEVEQQQEGETENGGDGREVEGRECKIDMLNNDCLMHIFSFLNKRERIGIERVCKRWQTVGLDMWTCQKHLDFASLFPLASGFFRNMPILIAFLKRCGANLQSLDISHKAHHLNGPVLRTVATYCTNLQCLNLAGLPVTSSGLRILSAVSYKLRVLNLDGCSGAFDKDLHNVFLHSPHLESVTLSHNSVLTGKCLSGLARAPLKELVMDGCNNLRSRNLVNGLLVLKSLSRLSLNSCINLTSSDVADITGAVPMLCSLSLEHYFPLFNSTTLKALNQLHDLISLTLQLNPAVNDQIMDVIARSCHKIEELNITGCSSNSWEQMSVTDVGLRCLAALPNLVCLSMSYLANVSDTALEVIASRGKLRKLMCRGCPSFTDVGCISVVASCNELELFDFSGCDLVSDATVQAALDSVKLRTNNIKLTLVVGGTSVSDFDIVEENSLLEVDCSDLCVAHLRPDFVDDIYFPSSEDEYYDDVDDLCDWECQSIYFGDDLEYYDDLSEDAASFGDAPCGFWEEKIGSHKKRKHKKQDHDKEDAPVRDEDAAKHGGWWKVKQIEEMTGSVAIEFGNQMYVKALDNGLFTLGALHREGEGPSPEEVLTAFKVNDVKVAFKSGYDKYLRVDKDGTVTGRSDAVGPMEQWEPIFQDGKVALLGCNSCFISVARDDDSLVATSRTVGSDEIIQIRSHAVKEVRPGSELPEEEQGSLAQVEVNYVRKFQKFQDKKLRVNTNDRSELEQARTEGKLHEALLDRRSKMKADRYCK